MISFRYYNKHKISKKGSVMINNYFISVIFIRKTCVNY